MASATDFCSSFQVGLPAATPANIAEGCDGLSSRVSSGCACYYTAPAAATPPAPPATTPHAITTPPTSPPVPTAPPAPPAKCNNVRRPYSSEKEFQANIILEQLLESSAAWWSAGCLPCLRRWRLL